MARSITVRTVFVVALVSCFAGAASAGVPGEPAGPSISAERPPSSSKTPTFPQVAAPDPVVRWMVDQVKQATVVKYAGDLSGEWPVIVRGAPWTIETRNTYAEATQKAVYYVADHLAALGLDVEYHRWGPPTAPNVIGELTGTSRPNEIYMVTAHLDDAPSGPSPGADDNASGSAAVLVAADILSQFSWDCTLRFALWTGKEQGMLGSHVYAERASSRSENIAGVLNLDMIGWNTPQSAPDIDLHANSDLPVTIELANQAASVMEAYALGLVPEVRTDGANDSDHASFWQFGYPAILGTEDYYPNLHDFDPYCHTPEDTLSTLDLAYFTAQAKAAVAEVAHLAGCLTTGTLQGAVAAVHDGSPVGGAAVALTDGFGRHYTLVAGASGAYYQAVPPGTYSAIVSAYGYNSDTLNDIAIFAGDSVTEDILLAAAPPTAPSATGALDEGEVALAWQHVAPNTAYRVRRSGDPYFAAGAGTLLATLEANHPPGPGETLTYRDPGSSAGDPSANDFYIVQGINAAGVDAPSGRVGEFDFALTRASGQQ